MARLVEYPGRGEERAMTTLDRAPELKGVRQTGALEGRAYSVLCAPIVDPVRGRTVAVLYLQNEGLKNAFGESDWAWMHVYARTLGRALAAIDLRRGQ